MNKPSMQEGVLDSFSETVSIAVAEVAVVVEGLCGGKAAGVDKIHPEMVKVLENVRVAWLMRFFNVA